MDYGGARDASPCSGFAGCRETNTRRCKRAQVNAAPGNTEIMFPSGVVSCPSAVAVLLIAATARRFWCFIPLQVADAAQRKAAPTARQGQTGRQAKGKAVYVPHGPAIPVVSMEVVEARGCDVAESTLIQRHYGLVCLCCRHQHAVGSRQQSAVRVELRQFCAGNCSSTHDAQ